MNSSELGTLLHLASPTLPIGGFSYSQGLEAAVSHGLVTNTDEAHHWIDEHLFSVIAPSEAMVWLFLYEAWLLLDEEIGFGQLEKRVSSVRRQNKWGGLYSN